MKEVLLLKCGEIVLKGLNRKTFEDRLLKNLKRRMAHVADCEITMRQSVVYVEIPDDADADAVMECASRVFGFATISRPAMKMNLDFAVEVKNFRLPRRCSTVVFLFRDVPPLGRYFSFENSGCVSPEVLYGTSILSSSSNTKNILGWNGSLTIRLIISIR